MEQFQFIDLKDFVTKSGILSPYKEEVFHFYGEQFIKAVDLWREGENDQALLIFDDVYEVFPHFFIHKFIRLEQRIRHESSEDLLDEFNEIDPTIFPQTLDKFFYHFAKALVYFKQFDVADCIKECMTSLQLVNDVSPVYIMLGDCLMLKRDYREAIKFYKFALRANYKINHVKANMAYAYLMLKKTRRATKFFSEIVDEFPDNYKVQYNMALCYLRKNKLDLALNYLKKVEVLTPNFDGLYLTFGGIYLKQKKQDAAIEALQKAVELGNQNALKILNNLNNK